MAEKLIEAIELTKVYQDGNKQIKALDKVSFTINKGELVVILGPSGAGKSTLLHILGGMEVASDGAFIVNNTDIAKLNSKKLSFYRRYDIGFVFQFYNLIPNLNAYENVALAASIAKDPLDPKDVLTAVGLSERLKQFPSTLSGGEQQRVAIARAIVKKPTLLLCDEPTGALDSKTGVEIIKLLKKIAKEENKTVIIVTHNQLLADVCDHLIRLKDGTIIENAYLEHPKNIDDLEW